LRFKIAAAVIITVLFFGGCATIPLTTKDIIDINITPDTGIKAGTIITATVKTTRLVDNIYAYLAVKEEMKIQFKYDKKNDLWNFKYMMPLTMVLPRGEFAVRFEAILKTGEKQTAERKISTN